MCAIWTKINAQNFQTCAILSLLYNKKKTATTVWQTQKNIDADDKRKRLSEKFNKFVQYAVKNSISSTTWKFVRMKTCVQLKKVGESFRQVPKASKNTSHPLTSKEGNEVNIRRWKKRAAKVFIVSLFEYIIFSHFTIVMENPCWKWMKREREE